MLLSSRLLHGVTAEQALALNVQEKIAENLHRVRIFNFQHAPALIASVFPIYE
jgi:hypothetical protein